MNIVSGNGCLPFSFTCIVYVRNLSRAIVYKLVLIVHCQLIIMFVVHCFDMKSSFCRALFWYEIQFLSCIVLIWNPVFVVHCFDMKSSFCRALFWYEIQFLSCIVLIWNPVFVVHFVETFYNLYNIQVHGWFILLCKYIHLDNIPKCFCSKETNSLCY